MQWPLQTVQLLLSALGVDEPLISVRLQILFSERATSAKRYPVTFA
jgi:hypothetical protein